MKYLTLVYTPETGNCAMARVHSTEDAAWSYLAGIVRNMVAKEEKASLPCNVLNKQLVMNAFYSNPDYDWQLHKIQEVVEQG